MKPHPQALRLIRLWIAASALLLLARPNLLRADGPASPPLDEAALQQLVHDLGHQRFSIREEAQRKLQAAGAAAVPQLGEAARSGQLEAVVRSMRVLAAWAEDDHPEFSQPARAMLTDLAKHRVNVAGERAASILSVLAIRDEEHAREQVLRLGAVYGTRRNVNQGAVESSHLVLARGWRGDVEGLKWLERIPTVDYVSFRTQPLSDDIVPYLASLRHLQKLELYGTKLSPEGLQRLRDALPATEIDFRRGGMLGVTTQPPNSSPCRILTVRENTGAAKAGIQEGDIVVRAEGQDISDFHALTDVIATKAAGENLTVEVDRDGKRITITAKLGEWDWEAP